MSLFSRKVKPISRKFWSYLNYLPKRIRAPLLRTQFQITYDLPKDLVLKQAETKDEITQALNLVYQSYIDFNYIDPNEAKLRLTKYNILPTTFILIAKYGEEVVGTLSIVPDSALGIPSELTFNIDDYRNNNTRIAEISSLAIKRGFRKQRGQLLLPLCKIMYLFCTQILKLDGIIVSTIPNVEAFYTDVLLFEKNKLHTIEPNIYTKGTPTTCCFLPLNESTVNAYKKVYEKKEKKYNLYHFFVEATTENIKMPEPKICFQSYTKQQISTIAELVKVHPELMQNVTEADHLILNNIDVSELYSFSKETSGSSQGHDRKNKRYHIRQAAWLSAANADQTVEVYIADLSEDGVKLVLKSPIEIKNNAEVLIFFNYNSRKVKLTAKVLWTKNRKVIGCQILECSSSWSDFYRAVVEEILDNQNTDSFHLKRSA